MYLLKGNTLRISVRNLVEFIFRGGDIDNRGGGIADVKRMQEGSRLHKKIQKSMGPSYHAEVPLKITLPRMVSDISYEVVIEGRADGIVEDLPDENGEVTIDEIKTVSKDVKKITEPELVHEAQALCYGYMYARERQLQTILIQVTYCNPETEEINRFCKQYTTQEVEAWFEQLVTDFYRWTDFLFMEHKKRNVSIQGLPFPFAYRPGQKNLVVGVYKAVENRNNLYIQASTGVGKTISTVYPTVQAMGQGFVDKIFYLTSKTITRTVAQDTYQLLREQGLHMRTITLTAKDKICILEERSCNPESCPVAKGHFDRINEAVFDMITHEQVIYRETVEAYADKHQVCPYEFALDCTYWCDGIICDYNYVFDPNASLRRFFGDGDKGDYVFLIDEAHNLVDRARQMYSATLVKEDFLQIKKYVKNDDKKLYRALERCNEKMLELKRNCDTIHVVDTLGLLPVALESLFGKMQHFLENHKNHPHQDEVLQLFFQVRHFLNMYDCLDEKYVIYTQYDDAGNFFVKLYCVDPSGNLSMCMDKGRSAVFFSATLLPVNYFKEMLTGDAGEQALYAQSSFLPENRKVVIGTDVSSRYTRRNDAEYRKMSKYIYDCVLAKRGKYMVFFPSYQYMEHVREHFVKMYDVRELFLEDTAQDTLDNYFDGTLHLLVQDANMTERRKELFLEYFEQEKTKNSLVGFCVMGGVFSEGIDLREESLIGAIVIGTGIPMVTKERNLLRNYFDACGKDGYAYAYLYPGMNKVLQSAGRVIRTENDKGVIVLLDDRFLTREYEMLFPREWNRVYPVQNIEFLNIITDFWKNLVQ